MSLEENEIVGLDATVSWVGIDPEQWRDLEDSEGSVGNENDDDQPWPEELESILGFDPSTIDWGDEG